VKVQVTLDYYDGSQSKARDLDMEEFPARDMMWRMMEGGVVGFTVTKKPSLAGLAKKLDELNEKNA
jgi:hypothetical protein